MDGGVTLSELMSLVIRLASSWCAEDMEKDETTIRDDDSRRRRRRLGRRRRGRSNETAARAAAVALFSATSARASVVAMWITMQDDAFSRSAPIDVDRGLAHNADAFRAMCVRDERVANVLDGVVFDVVFEHYAVRTSQSPLEEPVMSMDDWIEFYGDVGLSETSSDRQLLLCFLRSTETGALTMENFVEALVRVAALENRIDVPEPKWEPFASDGMRVNGLSGVLKDVLRRVMSSYRRSHRARMQKIRARPRTRP